MTSFVYFKFKSQKEPSRVTFDGTAISVFDLKREIIILNKLGDGTDFELSIYEENGKTEYDDDTTLIPRSTLVIARRLPALKPGRGGAARYVSGKAPVNAKILAAKEAASRNQAKEMAGASEADRMKEIFGLQSEQWKAKQEEMATDHRVPLNNAGKPFPKKNANVPEGEPPHGYVCYRCLQKGHWIQACPTNDDPNYDSKGRMKRTTGIPRSLLKTIDKAEIDNLDEATRQQVMINADGEYVLAQTDEKEWQRHQENAKASAAAQQKAQNGDLELQSRGLECPIDKRLFVAPVKTPCCQRSYCNECISSALIDSDLTCPGCSTENVTLEELVPDKELEEKIDAYKAEKAAAKQQPKSSVSSPAANSANSPSADDKGAKSPKPGSTEGGNTPKKRGADEISDSTSLAPEAPQMKRQRSGAGGPEKPESPTKDKASVDTPNNSLPLNQFMPPDPSQMKAMANFPMGMGGMPFMGMGMGMPMGAGMPMGMGGFMMPQNFMNGMNGMGGMNGMNGMNGMGGMNGMNGMNGMGGVNQGFNQGGFNPNNQNTNFQGQGNHKGKNNFKQPNQMMPGVPTGPRNATPNHSSMAHKFPNQQRPAGKDEDNAYLRQPVNPNRHPNRQRRPRPSDFREL